MASRQVLENIKTRIFLRPIKPIFDGHLRTGTSILQKELVGKKMLNWYATLGPKFSEVKETFKELELQDDEAEYAKMKNEYFLFRGKTRFRWTGEKQTKKKGKRR